MKLSIQPLLKEFSLHLIIIATTLALGYWYVSSQLGGEDSRLPLPERIYVRRSLLLLPAQPLTDVGQMARAGSRSDTLAIYRGSDSLNLMLRLDGGRAFFYAQSSTASRLQLVAEIDSLEQYQAEWGKIRLACDGAFFQYRDTLTYTCYHLPLVYIFDGKGECLARVRTIDQSPYPQLRTHMGRTTLEHGRAHNTNIGAYVRDGLLYVLSQQVDPQEQYLILDCYQLEDGQYRYSIQSRGEHQLNNLEVSTLSYADSTLSVLSRQGTAYSLVRDKQARPSAPAPRPRHKP